ncbi:hypothetical protein GMOD_00010234 [Pyrenophora seminiperda CCB06]|uniref:polynucleotide adenylyltransferase n=1 Tax=Pyrenophora seminiperda CCB06 TaxID=1302712 RepID=A0A3M7MCY6_9PLEO|nr:hypothetical protein GMOD_00010234 [Pyrenophora seminiperda CCB06]
MLLAGNYQLPVTTNYFAQLANDKGRASGVAVTPDPERQQMALMTLMALMAWYCVLACTTKLSVSFAPTFIYRTFAAGNHPPQQTRPSIARHIAFIRQTRRAMGDTYRPSKRPSRERPLADRMTFTGSGGNRPDNQTQFTFEHSHEAPSFPPASSSNARESDHPSARRRKRGGASHPFGNRGNGNRRGRGGFKKTAPHERALLTHRDAGTPERALGVADGSNRFLNPDDMSDDEDSDMDVDSSREGEEGESSEGREPKAARTQAKRADGDSVPKWSNPDPYTVLPPPDETTGKKRDVVKLIRKTRNAEAEKVVGHNSVAANNDFISLFDTDEEDEADEPARGSLNEMAHIQDVVKREQESMAPRSRQSRSPLSRSRRSRSPRSRSPRSRSPRSRSPLPRSQQRAPRKRPTRPTVILQEWRPRYNINSTPWLPSDDAYSHLSLTPDKWLHNEILDFYDFVAPKAFEHDQRNRLVERINAALGPHRFAYDNGRVLCFGSYPAGLYLPTADMDLVYVSDKHYNGGAPVVDMSDKRLGKGILHKAAKKLKDTGIPQGYAQVINAKVPIIKFQDKLTKLQVDISFENLSGVQAQATFAEWKRDYPDMVYLVALMKQFLAMRGLNEVHTGGIGGYTIICLIVHYLQLTPKPENLGECLLGFLACYGSQFDLSKYRIQMHPPALVEKASHYRRSQYWDLCSPLLANNLQTAYGIDGRQEKYDGLSIQDPNRPDNNISGGSHKAQVVFDAFREASETLRDRIQASRSGQNIGPSLLGCILGGNYEAYAKQRNHLKSLK